MRLHSIKWHQPADASAVVRAAQELRKLDAAVRVCPYGTGRWIVDWPSPHLQTILARSRGETEGLEA
jgi:hypothetical protein